MSVEQRDRIVLAGDIGGTKTNLGLFSIGLRRPVCRRQKTFLSRNFQSLEAVIEEFLSHARANIRAACFGVAGPVFEGSCRTTNLPWQLSETKIRKRFAWKRVRLLNDLEAMAVSVPLLTNRELAPLNPVPLRRQGNVALVAPGTGLGTAMSIYCDGRYIPVASEGGHADFAPGNEDEVALWQYLRKRYGHVSSERLLSGAGAMVIYKWLRDSGRYREPAWLKDAVKQGDPAKAITEAAIKKKDPLCRASLRTLSSILGATAGNFALTCMSTGGVYLGGGIPPKILPILKDGSFMRAFVNKGRFKNLMKTIPVRVILNSKSALIGAAKTAASMS
ncbi:MAG: glucokinase [Lentisphaerae bacterium]|nr:glucokinase [Lentisphaerota bacterium]